MNTFTYRLTLFIGLLLLSAGAMAQTADFTASPLSGCVPLEVVFKNTSTGIGTSTTYSWDFGDSKSSVLKDAKTTYTTPGVYTVTLTVQNGTNPPGKKSVTITIYGSPTASYSSTPLTGCPCTVVTFTNTSVAGAPGSYTSQWSFGDGTTDASNNTSHNYCTPGKYNIALKVTNSAGCSNTRLDTNKFMINEPPEGEFNAAPRNLCKVPDTTTFTATAAKGRAPYKYRWDFGDGSPMTAASVLPSIRHGYTAGLYTVKLVVIDANGCTDTSIREDLISAGPSRSDFSVPAPSCQGAESILFDNRSVPTPLYTRWIWSDGSSTSGPSAICNTNLPGTIWVMMIDSFGVGCIDTVKKNYTIYPKPKARFGFAPIFPCPAPATITFTNTTSGADSFLWVFGDATTSTLKNPVHTYTWDSIFTVKLIAKTSFGCKDTFRVRDTTKPFPQGYPSPFYDSTNSPVIIRVMQGNIVVTVDSAGGCLPFVFKASVYINTNTRYPQAPDTSRLSTCTDMPGYKFIPYWGCTSAGRPFPRLTPGTDIYPDEYNDVPPPYPPPPLPAGPLRIYLNKITSWYWDFGDGSTSTDQVALHTYTTEGFFKVKVAVTTANGCTFYDTLEISAGHHTIPKFSASPLDVCIHDSVTFTNQSSLAQGYTWRFGDGLSVFSQSKDTVFKHRFDKADTFRTVLYANNYGCQDTMGLRIIVRPPQADCSFDYSCDTPLLVRFTDRSKAPTSILWRFGDGTTSTAFNPTHIYSAPGDYIVSQIVYNSTYGCKDSIAYAVKVYVPQIAFSTPDTTVCKGDKVRFQAVPQSYWDIGGWRINDVVVSDTLFSHTQKFTDTGVYKVSYIAVDNRGCTDSVVRYHYIIVGGPAMRPTGTPLVGCAPVTVNFTDSTTDTKGAVIVNRSWRFGTLGTSSGSSANAGYTFPAGKHIVMLKVTDNIGCVDSMAIQVDARKPKANFTLSADPFACLNKDVSFFNSSTGEGLKYKWDFGDGGTSTAGNPKHAYGYLGTFTVRLIITDNAGCSDTLTKTDAVKTTKPTASFKMSDSVAICPPLFVNFTNTSTGGVAYYWDFDNGSTSAVGSPVAPFIDSGYYNIILVATDMYGCTDTAHGVARVFGYDGALKYSPLLGCSPLTVHFTADLINAAVMIWDFADGVTESAVANPFTSHTYTVPGAYVPRLILGDGAGCSASSQGLDTIKVDAVTPVISTGPTCIGDDILFTDASHSLFSDYASSLWLFEDGTTSTTKDVGKTYSTPGSYKVTLISTNTNGCVDTLEQQITVHSLPKLDIADTTICLGDGVKLSPSGGVSYLWLSDPTLSCTTCPDPVASPAIGTTYYFTGTDVNGCSSSDTVRVNIKTKTALLSAGDTNICEQTPILLQVSGAASYVWIPSEGLSDAHIADPVATLSKDMTYMVIGREGSCIPDTVLIKVGVYPLPTVSAGADQKVLAGTVVTLEGSGTLVRDYEWSPSSDLSCASCPTPTVKPLSTVTYVLKGTSEHGCVDTDDVTIVVFCESSQLFVPNTFTPNGDGQNDRFYPQGKGLDKIRNFRVYNRWGQVVYERDVMNANAKEEGWDGTFQGQVLGPDTFVYTLEAICDNGEILFWKGDVTLIK